MAPLPVRTAYQVLEAYAIGLPTDRDDPLAWLTHARIPVGPDYALARARDSLDTHYAWTGLSTPYGLSLSKTLERLQTAETLFESLHPGVLPHRWYEAVRPRAPCLSAFLGSVTLDRAAALAARFTFESQVLWLTQARDLLLDQLRRRKGRLQQKINARHLRKAYDLIREQESRGRGLAEVHLTHPPPPPGPPCSAGSRRRIRSRIGRAPSFERTRRSAPPTTSSSRH
ncbi:MAG: hypothetical protein ACREC5_00485, partial [Thermoplasmata archaeon]